jgi:OPT family oligopeptide transporter
MGLRAVDARPGSVVRCALMESPTPGPISDEEWYRSVYRPGERQFTARAVIFGCAIGSVLSAANLYTGFTIGFTYGASITAAISAWAVFKLWGSVVRGPHFTVLENNTMQTAAAAAGAMAGAGMVNAVPALMVLPHRQLGFFETAAWLISVAFLGISFAIPLKRQMINVENLKFPSGIAAAETTLALHGEGEGGAEKAKALFGAGFAGAVLNFVRGALELIPDSLPRVGALIGRHSMAKLTLSLDVSLLSVGAGALIGVRTAAWMAAGATVCWLGLVPWVADHGYVALNYDAPSYFGKAAKWTMWPGVTMLVVSGITSFALRAKSIVAALRTLGTIKKTVAEGYRDGAREVEDVEVPMKWFSWSFGAATVLCVVTQRLVFGMPIWQTLVAIALAAVLALVGTRAYGETDVNPIGGMGKVTQLVFAALAPGNPQTNLMAAGIAAAGSNNCGELMQDMKTGRLLGASPRRQFQAQLFGIVTGSLVTVLVFVWAFPIQLLGTPKYPAPAMQTWKGMAELLTKGLSNLPQYTPQAMAVAAVLALAFTLAGELGSARVKRWVPSATGIGLSFILPASNSYTFLLGAVIAALVGKLNPKIGERYTVAVASGLIAGESVMGVCVAIYPAIHNALSAGH